MLRADECYRGRHENTVAIRKAKKDAHLNARRRLNPSSPMDQARLAKLPQILQDIYTNDPYLATKQIRELLSSEVNPPIDQIVAMGVVPRLVDLIRPRAAPALQIEAAWSLTNIAAGSALNTRAVVDAGGIHAFTQLMTSPYAEVREQAVWGIGNIAGDNVVFRDSVLEAGALPILVNLIKQPGNHASIMHNAVWALSNFCGGQPLAHHEAVSPVWDVLPPLVNSHDDEIVINACWCVSYLTDINRSAVIASGVCPKLLELLLCHSERIIAPVLRAVASLVAGTDAETQTILDLGVLPCLMKLLGARQRFIVKQTCFAISNICAGNNKQVQAVMDAGLMHPLVALLDTSTDHDVRSDAAWAIANATAIADPEQIRCLVQAGIIRPMCEMLTAKDVIVTNVALDCLGNVLKAGLEDMRTHDYAKLIEQIGGLDKLEDLQMHANGIIHQKALEIICVYYGVEDEYDSQ